MSGWRLWIDREGTFTDLAAPAANGECDGGRRAFAAGASSRVTMNNLLFDGARRQYDETICGGAGAGPGFDGATAVQTHSHMTNCGSGGAGRWGGRRTAIGGRDDGAPS